MIPPRIIAFGSSSVYGRGDPEGGGFVGRLRRWHEPKARENLVYNLGIGGDTSSGMCERFHDEVSRRRPDLILLYPGMNDIRRRSFQTSPVTTSLKEFSENIEKLIELSKNLAPTVFISSFPIDENRTTPFANTDLFYLDADAQAYTSVSKNACDKARIPYLPVYETWHNNLSIDLSIDGLHGTPNAHEKLFVELREFLSALFI